jgi:membrane dipeptidase
MAIRGRGDLEAVLASWQMADEAQRRVGLVTLMEGADGIREPQEAEWWMERGVRIVGLAWSATRYAGGTGAPGPLTPDGRQLLNRMADLGLILDLSHASDESYLEALDRFEGVVIASHANPRACIKAPRRPERFLTDEMIRRLAERGGVVGVVPYNSFLRSEWQVSDGKTIPLDDVIKMIDHICQVTGRAAHVGLGSDFDGGFGVASTPAEIDTVADLQKIGPALTARGYSEKDVAAILGQNWIEILRRGLPA